MKNIKPIILTLLIAFSTINYSFATENDTLLSLPEDKNLWELIIGIEKKAIEINSAEYVKSESKYSQYDKYMFGGSATIPEEGKGSWFVGVSQTHIKVWIGGSVDAILEIGE